MKAYIKKYYDFFNLNPYADVLWCEIPECGRKAQDIHHIDCRGMGGNPSGDKDKIENLMALCREHHLQYGDKKEFTDWLKEIHNQIIN